MPKSNQNQPFIRGGKWNPDATIGYHWTDIESIQAILDSGQWEGGSVTINPAYRFNKGTAGFSFALVFDLSKGGFTERKDPTVPWKEWEFTTEQDIDIWDVPNGAFLGFGVRDAGAAKKIKAIFQKEFDTPDMFPIHMVSRTAKEVVSAKQTRSASDRAYCPKCKKTTNHAELESGVKKCETCGAQGKTIQERAKSATQKWYRADSGFTPPRGATAADVVLFEQNEYGNDDVMAITPEKIEELRAYPASALKWVTKKRRDAARYGDNAEEVKFTDPEILTADDGDGGHLVLDRAMRKSAATGPFPGSKIQSVVYHGTSEPFDRVDMTKGAQGVFWVTSDRSKIERGESGANSSKHIVEMYVNIQKPAGWNEYDELLLVQLKRDFDGVILPSDNGQFDAIVFKPSQVRVLKTAKVAGDVEPTAENTREFAGLPIVIEYDEGEHRKGENAEGKKWERIMAAPYGYIKDTSGAGDNEGVDVYLGADENAPNVYCIEQLKDDGSFDEYKVMLGCTDEEEAKMLYLKHYPKSWKEKNLGSITTFPIEEFREAVQQNSKSKTAAESYNEDGHWVGAGNAASGVLPVCPSKGTVCLAWRSDEVHQGNCWGTLGGACKPGMSPAASAKVELGEESGYKGNIRLIPGYQFNDGEFTYHNFIGVVPSEFPLAPSKEHAWETDRIQWFPVDELYEILKKGGERFHPGLAKFLASDEEKIRGLMTTDDKTAQGDPSSQMFHTDPNHFDLHNAAVSDEDKEILENVGGSYVVDEREVGDYDVILVGTDLIPDFYQIGMQRKGMSMVDVGQQMDSQTPTAPAGGWRAVFGIKPVIDGWLRQYGKLYLGSHNPDKTRKYIQILRMFGYKVGEEAVDLMGQQMRVPFIKASGARFAANLLGPAEDDAQEVEFRKMYDYMNSLNLKGRNPWYAPNNPWLGVRLYSDGWMAMHEATRDQVEDEGDDLESLKRFTVAQGWANIRPSGDIIDIPVKVSAAQVWYHGTNSENEFDQVKPDAYGILWLALQEAAQDYTSFNHRNGEPRMFEVRLKQDANIVDLRDLSNPIVREYKDQFYPNRPDETWATQDASWTRVEGNPKTVPFMKSKGVDGVIVNDQLKRGRPHDALALINESAIAGQKLVKQGAKKLSETQRVVLEKMSDGRPIFRIPGGFWLMDTPDKIDVHGAPRNADESRPWNTNISSIRPLERAGLLQRTNKWPEEWRDERVITDAGRAALQTGKIGHWLLRAYAPNVDSRRNTQYPQGSNGWALQNDRRGGEFGNGLPSLESLAPDGDLENLDVKGGDYDLGVPRTGPIQDSGKVGARSIYGPIYHGAAWGSPFSREIRNDKYGVGRFFSSSPEVAAAYGPHVYEVYVVMKKPFVVDAKGEFYNSIAAPPEMRGWTYLDYIETDNIAEWASKNGYDGVIVKNVIEPKKPITADDYIVFNLNQIRSAKLTEFGEKGMKRWRSSSKKYGKDADVPGQVYLLHFNIEGNVPSERDDATTGKFHARHYLGWAKDADDRIAEHANGTSGARIMEVLHNRGIGFEVARTWNNVTRKFERRIKNQGGLSRHCPICAEKGLVAPSRVQLKPIEAPEGVDFVETKVAAAELFYWNDVFDSQGGESFGAVYASLGTSSHSEGDKLNPIVGKLDYSIYENEVNIKMLQVAPNYRRQGIATKLYARLKQEYPDMKVNHGMVTEDGAAWQKTINAAKRDIYYHGTSIKNLRAILSEGLVPEGKPKAWGEDDEANMQTPSKQTYGGIYVTTNLLTATGAVRDSQQTGGKVVVCMELQPNTFFLDEDDIVYTLGQPIKRLSDNEYHVLCWYLAASAVNPPEEYASRIPEWKKQYEDDAIDSFKFKYSEKGLTFHSGMEKRVRTLIAACWLPSLARLAAHVISNSPEQFKRCLAQVYGAEVAYPAEGTPSVKDYVPSVQTAEGWFRNSVEKITRSMKTLARVEEGGRTSLGSTARIPTPIGYSGSNHILAVVEIQGHNQVTTKYGEIPQDFWKQWRSRMGGNVYLNGELHTGSAENPTDAAFHELADDQRGVPESAMLKIQHSPLASGVFSFAVEHIGDLTHRMAERTATQWKSYGFEFVKSKVDRCLRMLDNPYGFGREFRQNLENNYDYHVEKNDIGGKSFDQLEGDLIRLSRTYADAHAALPTFNDMQRTAQSAAVNLGKWDFDACTRDLYRLKAVLDLGQEAWSAEAGKHPTNGVEEVKVSHWLFAASYDDMFKSYLALKPGAKADVKAEIQWAKSVLKKADRITWFLRLLRLRLEYDERGQIEVTPEGDDLARQSNPLMQLFEQDLAAYNAKAKATPLSEAVVSWLNIRSLKQKLEHYFGLEDADIQNMQFSYETPDQVIDKLKTVEDEIKSRVESEQRVLSEPEDGSGDEPFIKFGDGWVWWLLGRAYCSAEAKAMGHCGNSPRAGSDDRIISLRQPVTKGGKKYWSPHLTFVVNGDWLLGEMKGRGNDKPAKKYHPYIISLLKDPRIKGSKGATWFASHNFKLTDLTDEEQDEVYAANPNFSRKVYDPKHDRDPELVKRIAANLNIEPDTYRPEFGGFVVRQWDDLSDCIRSIGNEWARDGMEFALEHVNRAPDQNNEDVEPEDMPHEETIAESIVGLNSKVDRASDNTVRNILQSLQRDVPQLIQEFEQIQNEYTPGYTLANSSDQQIADLLYFVFQSEGYNTPVWANIRRAYAQAEKNNAGYGLMDQLQYELDGQMYENENLKMTKLRFGNDDEFDWKASPVYEIIEWKEANELADENEYPNPDSRDLEYGGDLRVYVGDPSDYQNDEESNEPMVVLDGMYKGGAPRFEDENQLKLDLMHHRDPNESDNQDDAAVAGEPNYNDIEVEQDT